MRAFARGAITLALGCHTSRSTPPPAITADPSAVDARPVAVDAAIDAQMIDATVASDAAVPPAITIAAVGDIMVGTTPRPEYLGDGATIVANADLAFGNLEGPLYDGTEKPHCTAGAIAERHHCGPFDRVAASNGCGFHDCWSFRMPASFAGALAASGFDVLSIANNHIDDYGPAGRASTIAALDAAHVAHSGPIGSVAHLSIRGRAVDVIAFATYEGLNDLDDLDAAKKLVATSRATGAIVIASFHGGAEGAGAQHVRDAPETYWERRGNVVAFAHAVSDAGASLVIGHGPHVLRAIEEHRGHLIAYSLGTYATTGAINTTGVLGVTAILEVTIAGDGSISHAVHSFVQSATGPRLDPRATARTTIETLARDDLSGTASRPRDR